MKKLMLVIVALAGAAVGYWVSSRAGSDDAPAKEAMAKEAAAQVSIPADAQLAWYPWTDCPICGMGLGDAPVNVTSGGELVRLCSDGCAEKFRSDPQPVLAKREAAIREAQGPLYALTVCPISGEELGSMGDATEHVFGSRLVRFCCDHCVPKFVADPAAAFAQIDSAAVQAQLAVYPTDECPVMEGMKLDSMGTPKNVLWNGRLVRLCCDSCTEDFAKDPAAYVAKVWGPQGT
ncbi:MAG: hypothetical protein KC591_08810 [Gemmatimonadetes bacterium]|nr:hypothetical protein [Gemmatimonadota bacterium]